jgi:AcrR family transcriptional regulator
VRAPGGEDRQNPERARISAAIIELVGTQGYEETTVAMIVERAGVSEEDFERHFADKKDCFFQVFEELRQQYLEVNAASFAKGSDWHDGLRRTAYAAYDWFQEDPARARFMAVEALNAGDRGAALIDSTLDLFVELVHAGRFELDDPDSVPRATAESAVGSIWNLLVTRIRGGQLNDEQEVVPQLMFFAIMPYKGEAAARAELGRPRNGEIRE